MTAQICAEFPYIYHEGEWEQES